MKQIKHIINQIKHIFHMVGTTEYAEYHWNHRVIHKDYGDGEEQYSVHEVHYNPDGTINSYTVDPIDLSCETLGGLRQYIKWCLKSLDNSILEDGKIETGKVKEIK